MNQPTSKYQRPPLRWAGGKFTLLPEITKLLPEGKRLVEPFVGSGVVFLNTNYKKYFLCDSNTDLINLFKTIQYHGKQFAADLSELFIPENNNKTIYYQLRDTFNSSKDNYQRALLFLYLNRHCFNGLCRYNSKGIYNVPFGLLEKPYFPATELAIFYEKSQFAEFRCQDYQTTLKSLRQTDVVYCDPPYVPLNQTANFTAYQSQKFTMDDQQQLATLAKDLQKKQIPVLLSNHDLPFTRSAYHGAKIKAVHVQRNISCKKQRSRANELLALF